MTDEPTRPPLARGDWDGFSKAESLRRLLALAEREQRPVVKTDLISRLRATWALLRAWWRDR